MRQPSVYQCLAMSISEDETGSGGGTLCRDIAGFRQKNKGPFPAFEDPQQAPGTTATLPPGPRLEAAYLNHSPVQWNDMAPGQPVPFRVEQCGRIDTVRCAEEAEKIPGVSSGFSKRPAPIGLQRNYVSAPRTICPSSCSFACFGPGAPVQQLIEISHPGFTRQLLKDSCLPGVDRNEGGEQFLWDDIQHLLRSQGIGVAAQHVNFCIARVGIFLRGQQGMPALKNVRSVLFSPGIGNIPAYAPQGRCDIYMAYIMCRVE